MRNRIAGTIVICILALLGLLTAPANASVWWLAYSDNSNGLCMDVLGSSPINSAHVVEYPCNQGSNQKFQVVELPDGNVHVIASHSNKCIAIWTDFLGAQNLIQDGCFGVITEEWRIPVVREHPNGSVSVMFRNAISQNCITGLGASIQMQTLPCDSSNPHQVWHQHLKEAGGNN